VRRHLAASTGGALAKWLAPTRLHLGMLLVASGLLAGGLGTVVGIAAANPVSAADAMNICSMTQQILPGDGGSCTETIRDTSDPSYTGSVNVTLVVSTVSQSGGGSPNTVTPGTAPGPTPVGTEALLDGQPNGLQVPRISDADHIYQMGTLACFSGPPPSPFASYPLAGYCDSRSAVQLVASNVDNATFSDTITIYWSFPITAGNPYQGGSATISITPTFTGVPGGPVTLPPGPVSSVSPRPTPTSVVKGQSTTSPTPSPPVHHQKVLGAKMPTTGAQLPIYLSRILIVVGLVLLFLGLWMWRRHRYYGVG